MPDFHNPYHFVPVKARQRDPHDLATEDFRAAAEEGEESRLGHVGHHRYGMQTASGAPLYHGRLICRLENEDPFFIGAYRLREASAEQPACWLPFELENGQPAIPASSLRGLISAIAEAASNSALRVLTDLPLTFRARVEDALPLIGEIVTDSGPDGETRYSIRPLENPIKLAAYREREETVNGKRIKLLEPDPSSCLTGRDYRSYSADNREFWYLTQDHRLLSERDYQAEGMPAGCQRGILRILGIQGRERELPTSRIHELFIPYPAQWASAQPPLDAQDAVTHFHALADERTESDSQLPFQVAGSRRNAAPKPDNQTVRLRSGDLVYYRCSESNSRKVEEVALSAIWRKTVDGSRCDFFRQISQELLPFNRDRRSTLSAAELVFGFVEDRQKGQSDDQALALAGRVRFSFGRLARPDPDPYLAPVTLKILDSPKPPCPALYFKHRQPKEQGYIAKHELSIKDHEPQGRKFYLHRYGRDPEPWRTHSKNVREDLTQKSKITPVKRQRVFYFHVDFDNLTEYELGMLCYSLRPSQSFRHKLGMGKSIGLGRVRIDPVGLFLIDRRRRYAQDALFDARRYHSIDLCGAVAPAQWPEDLYRREITEAARLTAGLFEGLRHSFRDTLEPDIRNALELLGDPDKLRHPVHTPQVAGCEGAALEKETYRWFVQNDERGHQGGQSLGPLDANSEDLPVLRR